jgi:hypothetical protein
MDLRRVVLAFSEKQQKRMRNKSSSFSSLPSREAKRQQQSPIRRDSKKTKKPGERKLWLLKKKTRLNCFYCKGIYPFKISLSRQVTENVHILSSTVRLDPGTLAPAACRSQQI